MEEPALSVILPVYNAMPWLTFAVRDMLKQRLNDGAMLELLVSYDGGSDGSLSFLQELVMMLGDTHASEECIAPPTVSEAVTVAYVNTSTNPALLQPLRAAEGVDHPSFDGSAEHPRREALSAAEVAASTRREHRLRLLRYSDGLNRGQGAAMSLALRHARAGLIAQMESDDERPAENAFASMLAKLDANPDWDAVSCIIELSGWKRPGMQAYVAWQNNLLLPEQLAAGRYIEIPALHQTAIVRRAVIDELLEVTGGAYRDGPWCTKHRLADLRSTDQATQARERENSRHGDALDAPVDLWWWLSFFHQGKRCGKLEGPALFSWRQHPRQHTRTHGRLSIDNLRLIKVHFLCQEGGPLHGCSRVIVISVGTTLAGWAADLRAHPLCKQMQVEEVSWAPGKKGNAPLPTNARLSAGNCGKRKHAMLAAAHDQSGADEGSINRVVRLWAFGREEVRRKVRAQVSDVHDMGSCPTDVFVA